MSSQSRSNSVRDDGLDTLSCEARTRDVRSLYQQHSRILISALRKDFGDGPPDPEDIAHQAFEKLLARPKLSDVSDIPGFLWRTARNLVLTDKRSQSVRARHSYTVEQLNVAQQGSVSTPEIVFSAKQQLELINAVLLAMPSTRRRIFMMHRVDGLTLAEVARRLRMSRPGAAKHLARAVSDIDDALKASERRDAEGVR
ncbi:MAG: sigma-70 family RNA polymerase sigma factor [Pseudomonadota bacterium]